MDARLIRAALVAAAILSLGASHRTANFIVTAPDEGFAIQIADAAEAYRRDLAIAWLGRELPRWSQPCPILVHVGDRLGAGGATSFLFDHGEVFGWEMTIQGTPERLLDSVLPHEVTHTVFASHFRQPLPRWADEGACSTVEHDSERGRLNRLLIDYLRTGRGIAFNQMFAMRKYPQDILPLYAQGHSVAGFLIAHGGQKKYVEYLGAGLANDDWTRATLDYYGFTDLGELQNKWLDWVRQGSPPIQFEPETLSPAGELLAQTEAPPSSYAVAASQENSAAPLQTDAGGQRALVEVTRGGSHSIATARTKTTALPPAVAANDAASGGGWVPRGSPRGFSSPADETVIPAGYASRIEEAKRGGGEEATRLLPGDDSNLDFAFDREAPLRSQVARPQPPEQARQIILEWSRDSRPSAAPIRR